MKQIIAINKVKGWTSHDVIGKLRRITGIRKIGHAGTLDPLASGVLIVAIGRESTREISNYTKQEKEYLATIKFGQTSSTDDEEGDKEIIDITTKPTKIAIQKALKKFTGKIKQIPPIYSAIKINGKPACRRVRKGQEVVLEPREVEIKKIEIVSYKYPILKLKVICSSGVYIRSLARDLGEELKVGGYLADLIRTRIGNFTIDQSQTVEEFSKNYSPLV